MFCTLIVEGAPDYEKRPWLGRCMSYPLHRRTPDLRFKIQRPSDVFFWWWWWDVNEGARLVGGA